MFPFLQKFFLPGAVQQGAVCLDGSAPIYYREPDLATYRPDKVLLYVMHGGICGSTLEECGGTRSRTFFSSNSLPERLDIAPSTIFSNDHTENPVFYDYTKVIVDYCSGDLFSGDAEISSGDSATTLHFRGKRIIKRLVGALTDGSLLGTNVSVSDLVLYGSSAGGITILNHAWRFRKALPNGARIRSILDSAQFHSDTGPSAGISKEFSLFLTSLLGPKDPSPDARDCLSNEMDATCCTQASCLLRRGYFGEDSSESTLWIQSRYDPYGVLSGLRAAGVTAEVVASALSESGASSSSLDVENVLLSYAAQAGRALSLADQITTTNPNSVVILTSCTEHVLLTPTGLKLGFFGANRKNEYRVSTLVQRLETPFGTEFEVKAVYNADPSRESNKVQGKSLVDHANQWAAGGSYYSGNRIITSTELSLNNKDEQCGSRLETSFGFKAESNRDLTGERRLLGLLPESNDFTLAFTFMDAVKLCYFLLFLTCVIFLGYLLALRLRLAALGKQHATLARSARRQENVDAIKEDANLESKPDKSEQESECQFVEGSHAMTPDSRHETILVFRDEESSPEIEHVRDGIQDQPVRSRPRIDGSFSADPDSSPGSVPELNCNSGPSLQPRGDKISKSSFDFKSSSLEFADCVTTASAVDSRKADSSFGTSKPDSSFGTSKPDSSFGTSKPDCSFGTSKPDSSFGTSKPDCSFGTSKPDSSFGTSKPDSSFEKADSSLSKSNSVPTVVPSRFPCREPDKQCMRLTNVTFRIKDSHLLLANINCSFKYGRLTAVMGGSGSGKSTLCKLAADRQADGGVYSGTITLDSVPVDRLPDVTSKIGFVRQFPCCGPESCSVIESLLLTAAKAGMNIFGPRAVGMKRLAAKLVKDFLGSKAPGSLLNFNGDKAKVYERECIEELEDPVFTRLQWLISQLDMGWFLDREISMLSGGQKKLVAVAQTLLTEPGIVFLDEPTSGLDSLAAETLLCVLARVVERTNCCMVVVIHQPSREVYRLFDDLVLLNKGKLIYAGPRQGCAQSLRGMKSSIKSRSDWKKKKAEALKEQNATALRKRMMLRRRSTKALGSTALDFDELEREEAEDRKMARKIMNNIRGRISTLTGRAAGLSSSTNSTETASKVKPTTNFFSRLSKLTSSVSGDEAVSSSDEDESESLTNEQLDDDPDKILSAAMKLFQKGKQGKKIRTWEMLRHALMVNRSDEVDRTVGDFREDGINLLLTDEIKQNVEKSSRLAIHGHSPASSTVALMLEITAYSEMRLKTTLKCVLLPLYAGLLVFTALEKASALYSLTQISIGTFVVCYNTPNLMLPTVYSHLVTNQDALRDKLFTPKSMLLSLVGYLVLMIVFGVFFTMLSCLVVYHLPKSILLWNSDERSMDASTGIAVNPYPGLTFIDIYTTYGLFGLNYAFLLLWIFFAMRAQNSTATFAAVMMSASLCSALMCGLSGIMFNLANTKLWLRWLTLASPAFWAQRFLVVKGFLGADFGCSLVSAFTCLSSSGNAYIATLYGGVDDVGYCYPVLLAWITITSSGAVWSWRKQVRGTGKVRRQGEVTESETSQANVSDPEKPIRRLSVQSITSVFSSKAEDAGPSSAETMLFPQVKTNNFMTLVKQAAAAAKEQKAEEHNLQASVGDFGG